MSKPMVLHLKSKTISALLALALAGCANTDANNVPPVADAGFPVTGSWYSEFTSNDQAGEEAFAPFLSATLAQHASEFMQASEFYLKVIEADPSSRFVTERAFLQLIMSGRTGEALKLAQSLDEKTELGQEQDLVQLLLALDAIKSGDYLTAAASVDKFPGGSFSYILTPILKGWINAASGDLVAAKEALAALDFNDTLKAMGEEHYAYMLDYAAKSQDVSEAEVLEAYEALLEMPQPVSFQPIIAYAHRLKSAGKDQAARDVLAGQIRKFGNNSFLMREGIRVLKGEAPSRDAASPVGAVSLILYRLASELSQGRTYQAAVVYLQLSNHLTPGNYDTYMMLGNTLDDMELYGAAAAAFASVPETAALYQAALNQRIQALRKAGDNYRAQNLVERQLAERPNSRFYLVMMGDILREKKAFVEAIAYYDKAIDLAKDAERKDWFAYFARGVCHEQMDNMDAAEADFLTALDINPSEPTILNYLGYSWIDRGRNIERARDMIMQAAVKSPNDGFITDSLGWVYYLTGEYEKAVEVLEQAVKLEPVDATINDHLGDAYWRVGRRIEARFQWRHALDSDPEEEERIQIEQKLKDGLAPEADKPLHRS